jgi:hypothetical protein
MKLQISAHYDGRIIKDPICNQSQFYCHLLYIIKGLWHVIDTQYSRFNTSKFKSGIVRSRLSIDNSIIDVYCTKSRKNKSLYITIANLSALVPCLDSMWISFGG